ncbi:MAG: hypothetical protein ACRC8D_14510, partial [Aeromonas sp.]
MQNAKKSGKRGTNEASYRVTLPFCIAIPLSRLGAVAPGIAASGKVSRSVTLLAAKTSSRFTEQADENLWHKVAV